MATVPHRFLAVIAGLDPAIHPEVHARHELWMPGSSPGHDKEKGAG
jgi:hypothetical protein